MLQLDVPSRTHVARTEVGEIRVTVEVTIVIRVANRHYLKERRVNRNFGTFYRVAIARSNQFRDLVVRDHDERLSVSAVDVVLREKQRFLPSSD